MVDYTDKKEDSESILVAALKEVMAERDRIDLHELPKAHEQIAALKLRRERLDKAIDAMLSLVPPELRTRFEVAEPVPERGGPVFTNMVRLFDDHRHVKKMWSAATIQEALRVRGFDADQKQIHNVLNYLERAGKVQRVDRGRYFFLGMAGEWADELIDSLSPPWRKGIRDDS